MALAKTNLPGVSSYADRHGKTRWRYQRNGIRVELGIYSPGSAEFMRRYELATAGKRPVPRQIARKPVVITQPPVVEGAPGRRTALYRYFDAANTLLYVGISKRAAVRIAMHSGTEWDRLAARVEISWYSSPGDARRAERVAIKRERPVFNRADNDARNSPFVLSEGSVGLADLKINRRRKRG